MNFKMLVAAVTLAAMGASNVVSAAPKEKLYGDKPTESPQPEWLANSVIYEANLRQGTPTRNLKGLQNELPRLKDLGVDIVWLMPIHPISMKNRKGELGSYYAVKDYKDVNPEFGTLDDMKEFVMTAHNLGLKVIIDEVCNHSGCDNAWVTDHPEYYKLNEQGEMYGPFDWTDTYKLDYDNRGLRDAMTDALAFWVRDVDIDGFRFDVAGEVPTDFWEEVRPQIQAIKPVFFLAESSKPELTVRAFDSDYNWPMKDMFNAIAYTHGQNRYAAEHDINYKESNAADIARLAARQAKQYPKGAISMNMVTNHDLNSWEGTEMQRYGKGLGAFAVLSYTLPGIPMMYTGQEVGFDHPFEFFTTDVVPDYTANDFTAFYEMLNALKHRNTALDAGINGGSFRVLETGNDDILAFEREGKDGDRVVVIANLSDRQYPVKFKKGEAPNVDGMVNWLTGADARIPSGLLPWGYVVFSTK